MARFRLLVAGVSAFIVSLFAQASTLTPNQNKSENEINLLAQHPVWLKLLHYEKSHLPFSSFSSAVNSRDFFYSPKGNSDPGAELEATLLEFTKQPDDNLNHHAQCRFPARFLWLKRQLNLSENDFPKITCSDYDEWSLNGNTQSISIVFATGYLGNPASYYGHTLIKLNSASENNHTRLLDVSVNFGAIIPDNEDPVSYIVKGLVGGYSSGFSHNKYYFHNHNYGETELRDLWEYELNLSPAEVQFILAHAWEMLGQEYTYYFLNKNCAYRMAELLEIVDGVQVVPEFDAWVLPQMFIQNLAKVERQGQPLIKSVHYHPSRQSRLYSRFNALSPKQRDIAATVIADNSALQRQAFSEESLPSKHQILDTLLDYYQFVRNPEALSEDDANAAYRKVLALRYQLPPGESTAIRRPPKSPHQGRQPSLLQLAGVHNTRRGTGTLLTLRPAYYDDLDAGIGHIDHAELTMGKVQFSVFGDRLKLSRLQLVGVQSINTNVTGLPGDKSDSWRLNLGLEETDLACESDCLVARLSADKGYAMAVGNRAVVSGYLGSGVQDNRFDYGNLYLQASVLGVVRLSEDLNLRTSFQYREHLDGSQGGEQVRSIVARYRLGRDWDLRLGYERNRAEAFSLTLGHYW